MLKTRKDLDELRQECEKLCAAQKRRILVCAGTGCISSGSLGIYDRLKELIEANGIHCSVSLEHEPEQGGIAMKKSGCHGFCEKGPLVRIEPEGWLYTKVKVDDCQEIVERTILKGEHIERLAYQKDGKVYKAQEEIPFYKKQTRVVLEHCGHIDAMSIREYLGHGGYSAFEKALFEMSGGEIVSEVADSGLRGRGGGGFPAGIKWSSVRDMDSDKKYVVCNGDEGDPGAFMDRSIMEGDPHRVVEGMMIAAVACGADEGYIYVRAEYPLAVSRLTLAVEQARELGLLGKNILGSGLDLDIHISRGAGAFVCGEESALTASIEGKRGMPRVKPPHPSEKGLFDKPTVINNVETYANVPAIILRGSEWYRSIGTAETPGTKVFALTGDIENTGLIEVPMGSTLHEVIYDVGGGMRGGKKFKAVQIGGPSGGCLASELDMPLDFDSLTAAGAMVGSGGMVVMNEDTCMVEVARFFMSFTQNESCGKCVPCREGTRRMLEILERIVAGNGRDGDIELLEELAEMISATSLCGLGKSAAKPVLSTIKTFRSEYEAHIYEKRCPTGNCQKLKRYTIDPDKCKGCSKCARGCPVGAISGVLKSPYVIDQDKCIKCGACAEACAFKAVEVK